jgi:hypothetical protein
MDKLPDMEQYSTDNLKVLCRTGGSEPLIRLPNRLPVMHQCESAQATLDRGITEEVALDWKHSTKIHNTNIRRIAENMERIKEQRRELKR